MSSANVELKVQCNSTSIEGALELEVDSCWHQPALEVPAAQECPDGKWMFSCKAAMFSNCGCKEIRFLAITSSRYYDEEASTKCDQTKTKKQWCVWYNIYLDGSLEKKIPLYGPHYYTGEQLECLFGDRKITKIEVCNGLCEDISVDLLAGLVCHLPECCRCYKERPQDECESDSKQYQSA